MTEFRTTDDLHVVFDDPTHDARYCCTSGCTCDLPKRRDAHDGIGTYEARTPAGQTAPKPFTFSGTTITTPAFAPHVNAGGPNKGQVSDVTPTPDPYKKELAERRAAEQTPEQNFEQQYKA